MATGVEYRMMATRRLIRDGAWTRFLAGTAIVSAAVVLVGLGFAPERTWPNILLVGMYAVGLALAGMLFLAFHYLTTAGWSVCLKRIAEAMAATNGPPPGRRLLKTAPRLMLMMSARSHCGRPKAAGSAAYRMPPITAPKDPLPL